MDSSTVEGATVEQSPVEEDILPSAPDLDTTLSQQPFKDEDSLISSSSESGKTLDRFDCTVENITGNSKPKRKSSENRLEEVTTLDLSSIPTNATSTNDLEIHKNCFAIATTTLVSIEPSNLNNELPLVDSRVLAILAGEEEREHIYSPKPELILQSRWNSTRAFYYSGFLVALSTAVTSWSVFYAYNASISSSPFVLLLWNSSDTPIFTINLLTQISTLLLTELTYEVCEILRWSRASGRGGLSLLSFLALGRSTPPAALFSLAAPGLLNHWSFLTNITRLIHKGVRSFQWFAVQR